MEPVLGLIEDGLSVGLEGGVIDFLAAVRRQAMHYERTWPGERDHAIVELVTAHLADTVSVLLRPAHGDPDIGVEQVSARGGGLHVLIGMLTILWLNRVGMSTWLNR